MKRVFGLFLIASLLWCMVVVSVGAMEESVKEVLSGKRGTDARGFPFQVVLWYDKYSESSNDDSEVEQMLKGEKDGDLRYIDTMSGSGLSIGKVKFIISPSIISPGDSYPADACLKICIEDDKDGKKYFIIGGDKKYLCDYPKDGKRTLLSELLDTETAVEAAAKLQRIVDEHGFTKEACDLIKAELEKEYTPAWVLPTAICGGVVVLAGAAPATAVIIRRKKRKAAVADTPAEEERAE